MRGFVVVAEESGAVGGLVLASRHESVGFFLCGEAGPDVVVEHRSSDAGAETEALGPGKVRGRHNISSAIEPTLLSDFFSLGVGAKRGLKGLLPFAGGGSVQRGKPLPLAIQTA